jgi:hypothetical protein
MNIEFIKLKITEKNLAEKSETQKILKLNI